MTHTDTRQLFLNTIFESEKPVLIDFFAAWCGPCRLMTPVVDQLAEELKDSVTVYKIDVDLETQIADKFNITNIPTFIVIKNGTITAREAGGRSKSDLIRLIDL